MSSKENRRTLPRAGLAILAAALLITSRAQAAPADCESCQPERAGHADISVDHNDNADKPCVRLSRSGKHQAKWRSKVGKPLTVVFQLKAGQLPPFLDMDCNGSICSIRACDASGVCSSAAINPDAEPGCYRYTTKHRAAKGAGADPEVMIER